MLTSDNLKNDEPSHGNNIDIHTDDFNSQHGKTCSQSIVGELSTHAREPL